MKFEKEVKAPLKFYHNLLGFEAKIIGARVAIGAPSCSAGACVMPVEAGAADQEAVEGYQQREVAEAREVE